MAKRGPKTLPRSLNDPTTGEPGDLVDGGHVFHWDRVAGVYRRQVAMGNAFAYEGAFASPDAVRAWIRRQPVKKEART